MVPIVLAHGALGPFDELLFILIGAVFVGLMVLAWIRSRNSVPEENDAPANPLPVSTEPASSPTDARPDHFPLA